MCQSLSFPHLEVMVRNLGAQKQIFDFVRRRWLKYTPEEWVRQNVVHYLVKYKNVPASLLAIEMPIKLNQMERRCDIVVFNNKGKPAMVVECKAPDVKLAQKTIDQAGRYNITLKAPYLMVTNGLNHYAFSIDFDNECTTALKSIPDYDSLLRH